MKPIRSWSAAIFFTAVFVLVPTVPAQCSQWDVSGRWVAQVVNGPAEEMDLQQSGGTFTGRSGFYGTGGKVQGTVKGDEFGFSVHWYTQVAGEPNIEVFLGKIGADGKIEGTALILSDKSRKPSEAGKNKWSSSRPMKCLDKFKPITRLRTKPLPGAEPAPAPAPDPPAPAAAEPAKTLSPPFLTAGQYNRLTAGTRITWDGGKDHPYAEIWVKVDDGDETFVVEQGKGTRFVKVEKGKTYLYILTDSGSRLATVVVKAQ